VVNKIKTTCLPAGRKSQDKRKIKEKGKRRKEKVNKLKDREGTPL
jgi:hypothetical protein